MIPEQLDGQFVEYALETGADGWEATNPQFFVYVDGKLIQGMDTRHLSLIHILSILISTLFQAVGKGLYSLYVSVLRQLVVLVPAAFLLSAIGLEAVWFSFPIAEIFGLGSSIFLFLRLRKKVLNQLPV